MGCKFKNFLLTSILAVAGIFGVSSGIINNKVNEQPVVEKAEANTTSPANTMTLYILANGDVDYSTSSADCGVAIWGGSAGSVFYTATRIGTSMFSCTISTQATGLAVTRIAPGTSFTGWNWFPSGNVYNQSWDVAFDSTKDALILTGWSEGKMSYSYTGVSNTVKTVPSGTRYYIDLVNVANWWCDGYDTYMTFMTTADYYGSYQHWYKATRITNTDLFYVDIVDGLICNLMIVVRTNSNNWGPNQTANITDVTDRNIITPYNSGGDKSKEYGFGNISDNDDHMAWLFSDCFLGLNLCLDAGGLQPGASSEWTKASNTYTSVYAALIDKNKIKNITANQSSEDEGQRAMARYDAVVRKNPSYTNFIGRTVSSKNAIRDFSPLSLFSEEDNLSTVIIIAASSIALLSVTALSILVIKKRKNKEE